MSTNRSLIGGVEAVPSTCVVIITPHDFTRQSVQPQPAARTSASCRSTWKIIRQNFVSRTLPS